MKSKKPEPQVSISTAFCYGLPLAEQLPLIREAGFTHVSLGLRPEHRRPLLAAGGLRGLREHIELCGLAIDTMHARSLEGSNSFRSARNAAEAAAELGVGTVVLHAGPPELAEADLPGCLEDLLEACATLTDVARNTGVRFALENAAPGAATELAVRALEELDAEYFGLCYDSSGEQTGGPRSFELLERLGGRLAAVHLSDRAGAGRDHLVPGEGFIDWAALAAKLREAGYRRPVLLGAATEGSRFKEPREFLREACAAGRAIWERIHG